MPDSTQDINPWAPQEQSLPSDIADTFAGATSEMLPISTPRPTAEESFRQAWDKNGLFPDDFLIINDISMSDIPTNAIAIESESNVIVAETLRSKAPVVSSSGIQDTTVHLTLTFPQGPTQSLKLRRLISQLQYHPLVYMYNGKVRKALGISDPVITTMFILESGTLRSDPNHVGSIILDLTLHYFNYKPFSYHFWYNTKLPWINAPKSDLIDSERHIGDLTAYEASAYSLDYEAEKMARELKSGEIALSLNNPNVPANMPAGSDAWMFYADHLFDITDPVHEINSDYVGFKLRVFTHRIPPNEAAKAGKGLLGDLFKEEDRTWVDYSGAYDATSAPVISDQQMQTTSTTKAAMKAGEKLPEAVGTGSSWQDVSNSLRSNELGGKARWTKAGSLLMTAQIHGDIQQPRANGYAGHEKCNIHFGEVLRRSGYEYPYRTLSNGKKKYKGCGGILRDVRSPRLDWGIRLTGRTKDEINEIIKSGVPVGISNKRHVVILTKIRRLSYTMDGRIQEVAFNGYEQGGVTKQIFKDIDTEIVQCIPSGTKPAYTNPLGPTQSPPKVVKQIAKVEQIIGENPPPKQGEDRRKDEVRKKWINELKVKEGLTYYDKDPKIRNIFYQDVEHHISSKSNNNIATTAISITFGHRIVPQKLLSQDAYTWQFLGAGNKTGTLVFTFGQELGRSSADTIKRMINQARENARQFQSTIPEAGSIKLIKWDQNTFEKNTILSLLNLENVVVTDFSETSVPDGSDQHQLVVNFIAQDFAEEKLDRNVITSLNQKKRIIRGLMDLLEHQDYDIEYDNNRVIRDRKAIRSKRVIFPLKKHVVNRGAEAHQERRSLDALQAQGWSGASFKSLAGQGRFWKINPNSNIPGWLAEILVETAGVCSSTNNESPHVTSVPDGVKDLYEVWGADKHIIGNTDEDIHAQIIDSTKTHFTNAKGMESGSAISYKTVLDSPRNEDKWSRKYMQWLNRMDSIVHNIMNKATSVDFSDWFGTVGEEIIQSLAERIGECYDDMMLPDAGENSIPLPPDFYVYDDSHEDPAIASLTNDDHMEQFLTRHIRNERASTKRYIEDTLLGGSYISMNLPRVMESRKNYLDKFAGTDRKNKIKGEFAFMSFGERMIEGTKAWEPVFYRSNDDRYKDKSTQQWINNTSIGLKNSAAGDVSDDPQLNFMNNLLTLSPYLKSGRGKAWNDSLNLEGRDQLVESIYGTNWKKLSFGPNPNYRQVDQVLGGSPVLLNESAASNEVRKDPDQLAEEKVAKQAGEMVGNHNLINGGTTVVFGDTAAETQAIADEKTASVLSDAATSASLAFVAGLGFWANYVTGGIFGRVEELVGLIKDTEQQEKTEVLQTEVLQTEISKTLPDLDHTEAGAIFKPDSEDAVLAKMAKSIGFGTKAKDLSIRRAYPTFKIYFIEDDEQGSEIVSGKMVRAFDDFYSYSAVQEIRVIRSRKVAADLAVIRITNIGGKLLRRRFGETSQYERDQEIKHGIGVEHETGIFADTELENPFERMVLQDGVKVQIRLGFNSNPDHLETVFLGSIVEIAPSDNGKILEIVCQGFGAELEGVELGPLEDGAIFYSTQQALSGAIIQDSIVNFGRRSRHNRFAPGEARHGFQGGQGRGFLASMSPGRLLDNWSENRLYKHYFKYSFRNFPQDDNIFAPPPHVYASTWTKFWNNACTYRPLKQTPWQIFKEHELRHPGYIAMAVPYGHSPRMTMFFGSKSQHYWAHAPSGLEIFLAENATEQIIRLQDLNKKETNSKEFTQQLVKLSKESPGLTSAIIQNVTNLSRPTDVSLEIGKLFGRYKPFRNFHYLDSRHHILKNEIRTSRDGTFNEVEVLYFDDEGDSTEDDPKDLSTNIEALQRGEAGFLACKLDENMPEEYIRSYREEFPSCVSEDMARRYVQGLFARLLRDCYKGDLCILGEPTLKPYDVCVHGDTEIAIADGWKPIKQLIVGDKVISHTGKTQLITDTMSRTPIEQVKSISIHGDIDDLVITDNHPIYIVPEEQVRNRKKPWKGIQRDNLKPKFIPVSNLSIGDYTLTPIPEFSDQYSMEFAKLLGYYLAEGCVIWEIRQGNKIPVAIQWSFGMHEENLAKIVKESLLIEGYKNCLEYKLIQKNELRLICYSRHLADKIIRTGSFNSHNKTLLIRPTKEACCTLIGAYLDGDGSLDTKAHPGLIRAVSVSKSLIRSLKIALGSVGIYSTASKIKVHSGYPGSSKHAYQISIPARESHKILKYTKWSNIKLDISFKGNNLQGWIWNNYIVNPITNISIGECNRVYNISVANDESYVCGFTAVHNCYLNDSSINMTGPIEVEQVEHIFNRDSGYISIITPDLCVDINDYYSCTNMDLVGASLAYTFGLDNADTAVDMAMLASPLGFLAWTAGVKFLKWTQEGVPVITSPLVLEGKPFMSVSLGQKRSSMFFNLHGRWRQYWDDLSNAWDKFDMAESMFDSNLSWQESIIGFIGNGNADQSIPEAD